ncbi:MAG: zinc-ribbon domain-containing protein [Candidatus Pelagibacter sp.]|tara:strand:+ start:50 stop:574 length:525 start_codon:yes stop_codon:yes gene_type:complete
MILTCDSCGKKFVVPDSAITASGRAVQCGSCGNKWKQFPVNETKITQPIDNTQKVISRPPKVQQKIQTPRKTKKSKLKKSREIDLYSPEYLAKKHGIKLSNDVNKKTSLENKISFGFYNSLLLFIVVIIFLSRGLYFFQDFVVQKLPFTEFYIDYFFESIRNMFEIWKNLISNY